MVCGRRAPFANGAREALQTLFTELDTDGSGVFQLAQTAPFTYYDKARPPVLRRIVPTYAPTSGRPVRVVGDWNLVDHGHWDGYEDAEVHGGAVPDTLAELRELPGIGPYTLGAVASIAFGHPEPAVDGNVERVVSRHRGLEAPIGTGPARRKIRQVIEAWMPADNAGDFNQALMELGAMICTPTSPNCKEGPVALSFNGYGIL